MVIHFLGDAFHGHSAAESVAKEENLLDISYPGNSRCDVKHPHWEYFLRSERSCFLNMNIAFLEVEIDS